MCRHTHARTKARPACGVCFWVLYLSAYLLSHISAFITLLSLNSLKGTPQRKSKAQCLDPFFFWENNIFLRGIPLLLTCGMSCTSSRNKSPPQKKRVKRDAAYWFCDCLLAVLSTEYHCLCYSYANRLRETQATKVITEVSPRIQENEIVTDYHHKLLHRTAVTFSTRWEDSMLVIRWEDMHMHCSVSRLMKVCSGLVPQLEKEIFPPQLH